MAFDFKKEYKEFYLPRNNPQIVTVPPVNYIAVRGKGDPNEEGGAYQAAVGVLYAIAYTIKMSRKGDHRIDGYYDFDERNYTLSNLFLWLLKDHGAVMRLSRNLEKSL